MSKYEQQIVNIYGYPLEFKESHMGRGRRIEGKRKKRGKIEWMSPKEYIDICTKENYKRAIKESIINESFKKWEKRVMKHRRDSIISKETGENKIESYKDRWINGEEPEMCHIEYKEGKFFDQQGLHRALMAKDFRFEEIPVLIVNREE